VFGLKEAFVSKLETKTFGLEVGTPAIESIGPITFGPAGILFVADNVTATVTAIDLGDTGPAGDSGPIAVDRLDTRLASYLGCAREEIFLRDMAVNPLSNRLYVSAMRGSGNAGVPLLLEIGADGSVAEVSLENRPFSQTAIEGAPTDDDARQNVFVTTALNEGEEKVFGEIEVRVAFDPFRTGTVTDMKYADGVLYVAGLSNEEFSSTLRRIPFPFGDAPSTNSLEIYHVSHGKFETEAPIRTFLVHGDGGTGGVLASFTCTPIVHFSLEDLESAALARGRTVAELGNLSSPTDMLSYTRGNEEFLLIANTRHRLVKVSADDVAAQAPLTEHKEPTGVPREVMPQDGVVHLANRNGHVVMLTRDGEGNLALQSYDTATL
jgi:hypothetical protein